MVQTVFIFGSETWVVTPRMGRALRRFQDQVSRLLTERLLWYTSVAMARDEAGFQTIEEYIRQHKNTVTQYIAMRSLLDLCEGSLRAPGEQVGMW